MNKNIIKCSILSEEQAKEICTWRYEGEYAVYNFPEWSEIVKNRWGLSTQDGRKSQYVAIDLNNEFVAYGRIFTVNDQVFLGVGVKPIKCGNGMGSIIMIKLIEEAQSRYRDEKIFVEVRDFNKRAKRCYESIGFRVIDKYWKNTLFGGDNFYLLKYMK
ncbi:N-acetyltransferase [Propionigenium maris DSM 9537]|uniref:N-acetyltransferase n=1 Tax=Propionigenium maris DSM 9537 TaxID=1123000 RepID=A0A9W6LP24_9FUSO|nr:GNAT family N-acetyltransferase [Propionigenium maris]GLI57228.1 N-acetyltransferase [Propionigenium maris DSM 9537]